MKIVDTRKIMKPGMAFWAGAALALNAAFGPLHTWTGGDDGLRFSDEENWLDQSISPLNGWNSIILANVIEGAVISNDFGAVAVYRLKILAESKLSKLTGYRIALKSNGRKPSSSPMPPSARRRSQWRSPVRWPSTIRMEARTPVISIAIRASEGTRATAYGPDLAGKVALEMNSTADGRLSVLFPKSFLKVYTIARIC